MMVNWKFAWREVRMRPSRAILTLLSIVIGVAAVVAVTIASGTTGHAFDEIYKAVAGKADLEIVAPVGGSFDEKIVSQVRQISGVQVVAPLIKRNTILYINKRNYRLIALGVDPAVDQVVRDYDVTEGKSLREADGIMLDETFARNTGVKVGDKVQIFTRHAQPWATVVGFYKPRGVAGT